MIPTITVDCWIVQYHLTYTTYLLPSYRTFCLDECSYDRTSATVRCCHTSPIPWQICNHNTGTDRAPTLQMDCIRVVLKKCRPIRLHTHLSHALVNSRQKHTHVPNILTGFEYRGHAVFFNLYVDSSPCLRSKEIRPLSARVFANLPCNPNEMGDTSYTR